MAVDELGIGQLEGSERDVENLADAVSERVDAHRAHRDEDPQEVSVGQVDHEAQERPGHQHEPVAQQFLGVRLRESERDPSNHFRNEIQTDQDLGDELAQEHPRPPRCRPTTKSDGEHEGHDGLGHRQDSIPARLLARAHDGLGSRSKVLNATPPMPSATHSA